LLLKYLVFVRQTEEVFGSYLWGPDASKVLHYHLFYHSHGRVMGELTLKHLKVELNMSTYCHLAAALGCHLMVGIMDPEEELTTGMDAVAGRQTVTSEATYGLQPGEVGRVNDRVITLFHAMARLWHAKVLGLKLKGRIATLKEILHQDTTEEVLKGNSSSASASQPSMFDLDTLVSLLKTVFEESVVRKIVPALIKALEEQMADKVFREKMMGGIPGRKQGEMGMMRMMRWMICTFLFPFLAKLQEMLGKKDATFKSPGQYHTYKKLLGRKTPLVSISGTGSGKTLPFQLAMWSWPEEIREIMVLPYQVLHGT
jgi:hypothetical protein